MPSINDKIVLNFREVRKALADLPARISKNVIRRAMYAGAVVIRDDARTRAPVETGALRSSIVAKASTTKEGEIYGSVGVDRKTFSRGKRKGRKPRRYAHLVEFGTVKSKAQPFLRPAMDTNIDRVLDVIAEAMRKGIDDEAAKAARKGLGK